MQERLPEPMPRETQADPHPGGFLQSFYISSIHGWSTKYIISIEDLASVSLVAKTSPEFGH